MCAEVVVAKLVMLGISPLTTFILALREALVAKLVISGVFSSTFLIWALYTSFLLHHLIYLNQQEQLLMRQHLTLLLKLLKLVDTFFKLLISNLSTLDFKLAKLTFFANYDVSTPVAFLKSAFVA